MISFGNIRKCLKLLWSYDTEIINLFMKFNEVTSVESDSKLIRSNVNNPTWNSQSFIEPKVFFWKQKG